VVHQVILIYNYKIHDFQLYSIQHHQFASFRINKQRLLRLRQVQVRSRKILKQQRTELVTIQPKQEKRDKINERKAEIAARLDTKIKSELLERLKKGIYPEGSILNVEKEEEEELDNEKELVTEYVADISDIEDSFEDQDSEEEIKSKKRQSQFKLKPRKKPHLQLEYEQEQEREQDMDTQSNW